MVWECVWKECPEDVDDDKKYSVDSHNSRIITKIGGGWSTTIIGNTPLPPNKVTSWNIKILKIKTYCVGTYIGVAPFNINQNEDYNYSKCGWYLSCYNSTLCSGPPHKYQFPEKQYGPRKEKGKYVHTGDNIGVVMDTANGDLSFVLDGVNLGVAYEAIPLDKPLVPCVNLGREGDSVELNTSEVKEAEVSKGIPVPSNITSKSDSWDSITLTWDTVEGASFYQIEVDGINLGDASTSNSFIKRGLLPETEHSFKVRTVKDKSVSEWSGVVTGRTVKVPDFSECVWKWCPDYVYDEMYYIVDVKNPKIALNAGYYCIIIGNTPLPLNKVISWDIKILCSRDNNKGYDIYIGVAPFDINQNESDVYKKCGWYFSCNDSALYSGPPHNSKGKEYGPRKEDGEYVHMGDSVGVMMDTTKGELSFVLNGVNLGTAFEGIPLDKPLMPCVLLGVKCGSVELIM